VKQCSKCKEYKVEEDFHKKKSAKDGFQSRCKECNKEAVASWQLENPDWYIDTPSRPAYKRHHLSLELYAELLNTYNGKCWSCKESDSNLGIDHDHSCCSGTFSCGKCVRGVLCVNCNTALGLLKDSMDKIQLLLEYASKF